MGRNAVLEAMTAEVPVRTAYVAEGAERDDRLRDIFKLAAGRGAALLEISRAELDRLTGGAVHQGIALQLPAFAYAHPDDLLAAALDSDREPLIVALDSITDPAQSRGDREISRCIWRARRTDPGTPLGRHDRCRLEDLGRSSCSNPDRTRDQPEPQLAGVRRRRAQPDRT